MRFPALVMQTVFSFLFLIHYIRASDSGVIRAQGQEDHLADSPGTYGDVIAEVPSTQLTTSGDITSNTEPGFKLQLQQQTWLESPRAHLLAGSATTYCNNGAERETFTPSLFRRSSAQHAKRQSKTFCILPEPQKLQDGEEIPTKPEKKVPQAGQADSEYPGISLPIVQNIIMRARMWGSISQEPHREVCGSVEVPICAPFPPQREYPLQQKAFSHLVVPVRFCKFFYCLIFVGFSNIVLPSFFFELPYSQVRERDKFFCADRFQSYFGGGGGDFAGEKNLVACSEQTSNKISQGSLKTRVSY